MSLGELGQCESQRKVWEHWGVTQSWRNIVLFPTYQGQHFCSCDRKLLRTEQNVNFFLLDLVDLGKEEVVKL